ncbi:MAG: SDR family NAD(P)-dependent oxidoreductase [Candidatus Elarobacter sp.]
MKELGGKIAVVTGAGSGIGRALALAFARAGVRLALADRDEAGLHETILLLARNSATASLHVVDVADKDAVNTLADDVLQMYDHVDILVNNAGVSLFGTVAELHTDEIAWLMNVNFWGVVHGTKAFLPALVCRPEATIVNVSSVFGLWGPPGQSAYAASKFAVRGFSESLRAELATTNVRVVTVHPGGIKTAIARNARIAREADALAAANMMKNFDDRFLTTPPQTMAAAIVAAIVNGRERVVAGADANRIDWLMRLFPARAPRWFTRRTHSLRRLDDGG